MGSNYSRVSNASDQPIFARVSRMENEATIGAKGLPSAFMPVDPWTTKAFPRNTDDAFANIAIRNVDGTYDIVYANKSIGIRGSVIAHKTPDGKWELSDADVETPWTDVHGQIYKALPKFAYPPPTVTEYDYRLFAKNKMVAFNKIPGLFLALTHLLSFLIFENT